MQTRALVHIDPMAPDQESQVDGLKRLALLFDEIHYKLATGWRIREEVASDPRRYKIGPNDNLVPAQGFEPFVNGYNPLDDVHPAFQLAVESWKPELRDVIQALREAGIAFQVNDEAVKKADPLSRLDQLRSQFVELDYTDDEFFTLSGGMPNLNFTFGRVRFAPFPDGGDEDQMDYIQFPPAFLDSIALTETLFLSHLMGSNAVFLRPRFRGELNYRFRKYRTGIKALRDLAPELAESLRLNAHFGEVAFNVANSLISSELLTTKSIEDVLRFREELNESRQRFISSRLIEIDAMVSENAWSPSGKEEINRYIATTLKSDVMAFDDATKEIWESLFGKIAVKLAWVTPSSILGSTALNQSGGSLLGSVMPNATPLTTLLVGLLPIALKGSKDLVSDVVDAVRQDRKSRRSSIAYVSRLSKLR